MKIKEKFHKNLTYKKVQRRKKERRTSGCFPRACRGSRPDMCYEHFDKYAKK